MAQEKFRICPTTGLRVDLRAQTLIKWNAVAGIVFLAIGGLFGLSVALTRWPAVHLLPMDWFYLALTAHGLDVLLLWIIFFEIAVLYFAGAVLLGSRLAAPRIAWTAFALMLIGGITTNVAVLQGGSTVMFTSYVPMKAAPHFYLGLILFAVGALIACVVFFGTLVVARRRTHLQRLASARDIRRGHGRDHRRLHPGLRRHHPDSDVSVVGGHRERDRSAHVQAHLVGHGPLVPADQRLRARGDLVCDRRHRSRSQADFREGEPDGVSPLYLLPAARERTPPDG